MNFVVANYELLNGLSRGLTIVCNLMILLKKKIRKRKNVRYFFTIIVTKNCLGKVPEHSRTRSHLDVTF